LKLADTYGIDAFRYFLARDMVFGLDSEFVEEALVARYNAALANDLGNLWQRSLTMLGKFGGGLIPDRPSFLSDEEAWARNLADKTLAEYQEHFRSLAMHSALTVTWELVGTLNRFIDAEAPWALAKDPAGSDRLQGVLYRLIHGLAMIGAMIWPVMPKTGEEIWRRLGLGAEAMTLDPVAVSRRLVPGRSVAAGEPLFPRVEIGGEKAALKAAPKAAGLEAEAPEKTGPGGARPAETVALDEFKRLDLRVAEVVRAENVPKSDKLLKLTIRLGQEERTIVAGLAKHYRPEDLAGRSVIIAANLAPVKLMGIRSEGMVLAASVRAEGRETLALLTTSAPLPSGAKVS
ncbi:MAG: methionine--tRNA ligase subunit beta, partial [Candidatus Adiutrix sp.]|nr:methionine--tRNA ligase subunit beta [Candidatus Adiutrix sp.]